MLIDFYAGFAGSDDHSLREAAFNTALAGFQDTEALSVTMVNGHEASIDITRLLVASGVTLQWLVDRLTTCSSQSEEEIIFDLRQFLASQED